MRLVAAVEDVVLQHEEDVEHDGEETEAELGRVPKDGGPVIVVVADQDHLDDAERAASEVKKDVSNAPAHSALSPYMQFLVQIQSW